MKKRNMLAPENCNKAMCKSCVFQTDGKAISLTPGRKEQIQRYLIGQSSHECHVTKKTCYGGLSWQALIFYRMGLLAEETVDCFLKTAADVLRRKTE